MMKQLSTTLSIVLLLTGCTSSDSTKFTLAELKEPAPDKSYNPYSACVARGAGSILWPDDVGGTKVASICRDVTPPSGQCLGELTSLAGAIENKEATLTMINGTRDACEPDRTSGTPYVKAPLAWSIFDTEQDFWEAADGDALKHETATRQRQRTAFQRKWLPQIRQCYEIADAASCYVVLTAQTTIDDGERGQGYLTDYGCTYMVNIIADRQALNNQDGFVVAAPSNIPLRPSDKDEDIVLQSDAKHRGESAMWCNLELRKSGLPELK